MKALLIVDVQNDFLPGGSLAVKDSDQILEPINKLLNFPFDLIVASRDFHPKNHISFASTHNKKIGDIISINNSKQILWPDHCVQNTNGSLISNKLDLPENHIIVDKGTNIDIDSYSAFFDNAQKNATPLNTILKSNNIHDVYVVGLCTEYCVKYTALDAASLGYNTHLVLSGCKGISQKDIESALLEMRNNGVTIHETFLEGDWN